MIDENEISGNLVELINLLGEPEYISQKEISFWCPKCNPPHHKPKLFVNKQTMKAHCFVCGFKANGLDQIAYAMGKRKKYNQNSHNSSEIISLLRKRIETYAEAEDKKIKLPYGLFDISNSPQDIVYPAINFLKKRGVCDDDIVRWRMMYGAAKDPKHNMRGRIVIPSYGNNGKINYYIGRSVFDPPKDQQFFLNYKLPPADVISKNEIIFNEVDIDWELDIVLVEGVFDAIKISNAIPLLGKSLSEESKIFKKILEHDASIIMMLDGDAAKDQIVICDKLYESGIKKIKCVWLPHDIDPGMLDKQSIISYLNNAEPFLYNKSNSLLDKILKYVIH
jgi:hypothetical protein